MRRIAAVQQQQGRADSVFFIEEVASVQRECRRGYPQSFLLAIAAPSAIASNFFHVIGG
jgi:hypothetical protein